ncbi:Acyl-CoA thioesterase, partial [Rhizoctonia solani]
MAEFTEDSAGEHELISTSLELEQLDSKLFRSKSLWTPPRSRGVFGGQVISQALVAATRSVEKGFSIHSLHCYFLMSADASVPIIYYVEPIRDGKTYCARSVKAAQNGRWIFMLTCSFQRPEHGQPSHQWAMPRNVPAPENCPYQEDVFKKYSEKPGLSDDIRQMWIQYAEDRKRSPIAIKPAGSITTPDGLVQSMYWMRAKNAPTKFQADFQKCVLAYMSDLNFIGVAARSTGLHSGVAPPNRLGMISSLDHTIWYYDHDFDCKKWLLFVTVSPRTGLGRGVVHGRVYTQKGTLIAVVTQEGVVRADLAPRKHSSKTTMDEDEIIDVVATDPAPIGAPLTIDTNSFYSAPSPLQTPNTLLSGRPRRESAGIRRASMSYDPDAWEPNRSRAANRAAKAKIKNIQATGVTPKVKLKLTEKSLTANGGGMSFMGSYDRELDSDEDEDLVFEEQFILRMPPGDDCECLRRMVQARDVKDDVWFKFKDSRRAVFHIGGNTYNAKLVDLPAIIESQKTLDNRQMYKVADICQMLVVEDKIISDEPSSKGTFNIEDYIWPHGLTPPMQHVRKRRFRKRVNRTTIETVEKEVERLLDTDSQATNVKYEILEDVDPNLSDSEFDPPPEVGGSEAATPGAGMDMFDGEDGYQDATGMAAQQEDDLFEQELQAELAKGLGEESDDDDDDDDEDQEEESESEEDGDEEEDEEFVRTRKLLNEEIRDLEAAVAKKEQDISGTQNILIKRRFEDALKKLKADLEAKVAQRAGLLSAKDKAEAAAAASEEEEEEDEEEEEEEEDPEVLDGEEQPVVLNVGGIPTVIGNQGGVDSREMSTPRGDLDVEIGTPVPSQPGTPAPDGMDIG